MSGCIGRRSEGFTVMWHGLNYAMPQRGVSFHAGTKANINKRLRRVMDGYGDGHSGATPCIGNDLKALVWCGMHARTTGLDPDYSIEIGPRGGIRWTKV